MSNMIVAQDITDLIGKTPMLRLNRVVDAEEATIYAKLEWYNIGGSVKDRMALYLIEYAEASGKLTRDKRILEATSGNTGIALAMMAAAKGYKITIVMPESVSIERRKIIEAYGAKLVLSPGSKGTGGAVEVKQKMLKDQPEEYIDIDQFKDPANILAHYQTTGKEILEQTKGHLDMVVVGVGTAGTGVGVSLRIKESRPDVKVVGVIPRLGVKIQGLRNPGEPYPTQLFRKDRFDEIIEITEEEVCETSAVARRMAREEGLLVGMSSGAILYVALKKARELGAGKTVVAILPDSGDKYLSTSLFQCEEPESHQPQPAREIGEVAFPRSQTQSNLGTANERTGT
jgi:cysteine synthase